MFVASRRIRNTVVALVIGLGFWQLGHGAYIPAKAWLAQELMQRAWTRTESGASRERPWPWADTWPVARLMAPQHGVDLIVLAGGTGRTLAFGPGHMSASAMPGERGNIVVAGHRDTHFRFLKRVEPGEFVTLEAHDGSAYVYEIVDVDIVDSQKTSLLLDTDTSTLSLVTCYPFNSGAVRGPLRYVVTARIRT